ncbi:MAG: ACP S-malonyltransferase [Phycisphaerales bacterium]|nr:MAG: ACP S-malonyltransferase [Phycisphaerales bacterium]
MSAPPTIILCPGQGAQVVGMARAWHDASPEARTVFDQAEKVLGNRLGSPLRALCFEGPAETLNRTDISQPAIFVASVAAWRGVLAKLGMGNGELPLAATAGLSLGEYTALHLAGAMAFDAALELVTLRGRAMQDAAEAPTATSGGGGGMVAIIGADEGQAQRVCDEARAGDVLVCANFNAPGQIVLSGHRAACERAAEVAAAQGCKATVLQVAGAFHSPLMRPAAMRLEEALARTSIAEPRCPVMSNVTAEPHTAQGGLSLSDSIRRRLVEQLTSPVRWAQCCQWLASRHASAQWREPAPGRTLAGLMRRIDKSIKIHSDDAPPDAAA